MSVGRSVRRSVRYIYFWSRISLFQGLQKLINAPAQPHATEIAVYTALLEIKPSEFRNKSAIWASSMIPLSAQDNIFCPAFLFCYGLSYLSSYENAVQTFTKDSSSPSRTFMRDLSSPSRTFMRDSSSPSQTIMRDSSSPSRTFMRDSCWKERRRKNYYGQVIRIEGRRKGIFLKEDFEYIKGGMGEISGTLGLVIREKRSCLWRKLPIKITAISWRKKNWVEGIRGMCALNSALIQSFLICCYQIFFCLQIPINV